MFSPTKLKKRGGSSASTAGMNATKPRKFRDRLRTLTTFTIFSSPTDNTESFDFSNPDPDAGFEGQGEPQPGKPQFIGSILDGKKQGNGRLRYLDAEGQKVTYVGAFKDDMFHGQGRLMFENGAHYEGFFEDGVYHTPEGISAKEVVLEPIKETYVGGFKDGKRHGAGKLTNNETGEVDIGSWIEGKKEGRFRSRSRGGSTFEMDFIRGDMAPHGRVNIEYADGRFFKGFYVNRKKQGPAIEKMASGTLFEGKYSNGKIDGLGKLRLPNGEVQRLYFKEGNKNGPFIYTTPELNVFRGINVYPIGIDGYALRKVKMTDNESESTPKNKLKYYREKYSAGRKAEEIEVSEAEIVALGFDEPLTEDWKVNFSLPMQQSIPQPLPTENKIISTEPTLIVHESEVITNKPKDVNIHSPGRLKSFPEFVIPEITPVQIPVNTQYDGKTTLEINGELAEYEGQLYNDIPHGKGIITFKNGNILKGNFLQGKIFGDAEITEFNKKILFNGKPTLTSKYRGKFKDFRKDERGKIDFETGDVLSYDGSWERDIATGKGTIKYRDSAVYIGEVMNMLPHGEGFITYQHGDTYKGHFQNGKKHGEGVYTFPNGDVYDGEFKNGAQDGYGLLKFRQNNISSATLKRKGPTAPPEANPDAKIVQATETEGFFKHGEQHGPGITRFSDGSIFRGIWEKGMRNGAGIKVFHNKERAVKQVYKDNIKAADDEPVDIDRLEELGWDAPLTADWTCHF